MNDWLIAALALGAFASLVVVVVLVSRGSSAPPPAPPDPPPAPPPNPNLTKMKIPASGRETFTPVLLADRVYRFTISGCYDFSRYGTFSTKHQRADGVFCTNHLHNFLCRYQGFHVNGESVAQGTLACWKEDRRAHQYSFQLDGQGEWLPVQLEPPPNGISSGSLSLSIELLPPGTPTSRERAEAAAEVKAQKAAAKRRQRQEQAQLRAKAKAEAEARKREEEEAQRQRQEQWAEQKSQAVLKRKVAKLALRTHEERNIFDSSYQTDFVRRNRDKILNKLGHDWRQEYEELKLDEQLVAALTEQAPGVLKWHEKRLDLVLMAERLAVAPAKPVNLEGPVPLTPQSVPHVQHVISELFRLAEGYHSLREQEAWQDQDLSTESEPIARLLEFNYAELRRFGICASTPQEAEKQFQRLRPRQRRPHPYLRFRERLEAGDKSVAPVLVKRLQLLHRENQILSAKRREAVKRGPGQFRDSIDRRLARTLQEASEIHSSLESQGLRVDFGEHGEFQLEPQQESLRDLLLKLNEEEEEVVAIMEARGSDEQTIEQVRALFAQRRTNLFGGDDEEYT